MNPQKQSTISIRRKSTRKLVSPLRWQKFRCNRLLDELEMAELRLMRRILRQLERLNNSTKLYIEKPRRDIRYECTCFCILGIVVVLSILYVVLKAIEAMSTK